MNRAEFFFPESVYSFIINFCQVNELTNSADPDQTAHL